MLEDYDFKISNNSCKCINCAHVNLKECTGSNKKLKLLCDELSKYEESKIYVKFSNICCLWILGRA